MTFLLWIALVAVIAMIVLGVVALMGIDDGTTAAAGEIIIFALVLRTLSLIVLLAVFGQVVLAVATGIIEALS